MSFADYLPSIVAFFGIPLTAVVTLWRDGKMRREQEIREDKLRDIQQKREDAIRSQQLEREDRLAIKRQEEWIDQHWWEKKAATYSEITEVIWNIADSDRRDYNELIEQMGYPYARPQDGPLENAATIYWENRRKLEKAASIGEFMISRKAADLLRTYLGDFEKIMQNQDDEHYGETLSKFDDLSHQLLINIREAAREDLGLEAGMFMRRQVTVPNSLTNDAVS